MEHGLPDDPHQVAKEGTVAHWVGETCLLDPSVTPESMIGQVHENGVLVDSDMADAVDDYLVEVRSVVRPNVDRLYVEQALSGEWVHPSMRECTPDAWYYCSETKVLYLWDLKYGWLCVDPVEYWQFVTYLAAILCFLGNVDIVRIEVVVVQPRPSHPQGRIRRWHTTLSDLGPLFDTLQKALVDATGNNPTCVTGSHCRDCKALAMCDAAQLAGYSAVEMSSQAVRHDPSLADIASELDALKEAEDALKYRKAALGVVAISHLNKGALIPGYGLERSYGKQRWKGDDDEVRALEVMTGVTLFKTVPVTPAQAKRNGLDDLTKKIYVETPETGRKLVKIDSTKKATEVFGGALGEAK
jgi:hypothetical protein